jgi:lysozyme
MQNKMSYTSDGLHLTEQFEGCRLTAYRDVRGILTIGWGHTGPEVVEGLIWTEEQAEQALQADIQWAANIVNCLVTTQLSQDEFNAVVDFVFNVGSGNFASSTLLKELNAGDFVDAADQFARWDRSGGQVVAGLLRRRLAERQEFEA